MYRPCLSFPSTTLHSPEALPAASFADPACAALALAPCSHLVRLPSGPVVGISPFFSPWGDFSHSPHLSVQAPQAASFVSHLSLSSLLLSTCCPDPAQIQLSPSSSVSRPALASVAGQLRPAGGAAGLARLLVFTLHLVTSA